MAYFTFQNTVVVPYESLLRNLLGGYDHKGGPIWPSWDMQKGARFNRGPSPADTLPDSEEPKATISGDGWTWAGPITAHFGHGISDYATRIAGSLAEIENAKLVFSSERVNLVKDIDTAPKWFSQMLLDWFEIERERIHFVTEPTLFHEINVAPQGEWGPDLGPSGRYLDLLDAIMDRHFGRIDRRGTVYVSRAGIAGKFAGEITFEAAIRAAGITIFRPETAPLVEQLRAFAEAERLIFAEGSALHGAQLMGRALGDVTVINRRRGFKLAEAFIRPRSRSLEYLDHVGGMVYGLTEAGKPAPAIGISFMNMPALLDSLEGMGIKIKAHWDQKAYDTEIWNDLMMWLRATSRRPSSRLPESRDLIYHTLGTSGFASWLPRAREVLGEDRATVLA
jgi:hypothetical protein